MQVSCLIVLLLIVHLPSAFLQTTLEFLHTNDMHARFDEVKPDSRICREKDRRAGICVGGFARIVDKIKWYRTWEGTSSNVLDYKILYLIAGDTFAGSNLYDLLDRKICAEFVNLLGADVMALGHHEFDKGIQGLVPFITTVRTPFVAANLDLTRVPELQNITKSVVLKRHNVDIGIIGYITPDTAKLSNTGEIKFSDEVPSIKAESERLDRQGVKIIVALGHSGFEMDQKIAAEVPLVDLVIGGRSMVYLTNNKEPEGRLKPAGAYPKVVVQKSGRNVLVVQAGSNTMYLGWLRCTFDSNGELQAHDGDTMYMSHGVEQDVPTQQLIEKYRKEIEASEKIEIGKTKVLLDASKNVCLNQECNMGNMIADAYVSYIAETFPSRYWSSYPIALFCAGSIKRSISAVSNEGSITRSDLIAVLPHYELVVACSIKGSDLLATLEFTAALPQKEKRGGFLQLSGINVLYDMTRPPGKRVVLAEARCAECLVPSYAPINPNATYNIITTDFALRGGNKHLILKEKHFNPHTLNVSNIDMIVRYLNKSSPLIIGTEGRITFVNTTTSLANVPAAGRFVFSVLFIVFVF